MSKKHPSAIEARWRWHWRRMRQLKAAHAELCQAGDPLGLAPLAHGSGLLPNLEMVVQDEAEFFAQRRADHHRMVR